MWSVGDRNVVMRLYIKLIIKILQHCNLLPVSTHFSQQAHSTLRRVTYVSYSIPYPPFVNTKLLK